MVKGVFIVLDGLDGSGKSEMLIQLNNYLSKNDKYKVLVHMFNKELRLVLQYLSFEPA